MTYDQSLELHVGSRVSWQGNGADLGTVKLGRLTGARRGGSGAPRPTRVLIRFGPVSIPFALGVDCDPASALTLSVRRRLSTVAALRLSVTPGPGEPRPSSREARLGSIRLLHWRTSGKAAERGRKRFLAWLREALHRDEERPRPPISLPACEFLLKPLPSWMSEPSQPKGPPNRRHRFHHYRSRVQHQHELRV
jgi:hypothetical protein